MKTTTSRLPTYVKYGEVSFMLDSKSIKSEILKVYNNPALIGTLSEKSVNHSQNFDWEKCADKTFEFLASVK